MNSKNTLVIGASDNPERYAYKAVQKLQSKGVPVFAEGLRSGNIGSTPISTDRKHYNEIDTVTLYVGKANQPSWYDYILSLQPKRIIFNPGTENEDLKMMVNDKGIETIEACTLVMLSIGNY